MIFFLTTISALRCVHFILSIFCSISSTFTFITKAKLKYFQGFVHMDDVFQVLLKNLHFCDQHLTLKKRGTPWRQQTLCKQNFFVRDTGVAQWKKTYCGLKQHLTTQKNVFFSFKVVVFAMLGSLNEENCHVHFLPFLCPFLD